MSRIFVTGIGIVSPIGNNVAENHLSLLKGECGVELVKSFASKYADELPFGVVGTSDDALKKELHIEDSAVTRTTILALKAAQEAINDAGLSSSILNDSATALIGASTVGGMCMTDALYYDANNDNRQSSFLSSYDCAATYLFMQKHFGIKGIVNTINTACSSSANAIMYGVGLLKTGLANKAIVGGADALSKFTINGFNALHILSSNLCKPFDKARRGLNLGEGAAFLVLEKEEDISNKKVYAEISGYGNATDAYHASSISDNGEGPYQSMKAALAYARMNAEAISYINAHGTATENNDITESQAMLRIFGKDVPAFSSTKSFTGHTLGAAGAIEAVYSILSIYHQEVYPNLRFEQPINETGLTPLAEYKRINAAHVMSNSFGFGGNCTSLIFSKVS